MKKSFLIVGCCLTAYMLLASQLVTKISAHQNDRMASLTASHPTAINFKEKGFNLQINPNTELISFHFTESNLYKQLYISDDNGQKFYVLNNCKGKFSLNTKTYSNGIYYITAIKNNGEKLSKKFVVNH